MVLGWGCLAPAGGVCAIEPSFNTRLPYTNACIKYSLDAVRQKALFVSLCSTKHLCARVMSAPPPRPTLIDLMMLTEFGRVRPDLVQRHARGSSRYKPVVPRKTTPLSGCERSEPAIQGI